MKMHFYSIVLQSVYPVQGLGKIVDPGHTSTHIMVNLEKPISLLWMEHPLKLHVRRPEMRLEPMTLELQGHSANAQM